MGVGWRVRLVSGQMWIKDVCVCVVNIKLNVNIDDCGYIVDWYTGKI